MTASRNQERELRRERDRNEQRQRDVDHIRERELDRSSDVLENEHSLDEDNTLKGIEKSDIYFLESKSLYNLVLNEINQN